MNSFENYSLIAKQLKDLEASSKDVAVYSDLLAQKNALEVIVKSEARVLGSYEDKNLLIKVSAPSVKFKTNFNLVQELATPEEWEIIGRQAMDYEIHGGKLQTLIDQKLVNKKVGKAIEVIEPTPAVTIRLKN